MNSINFTEVINNLETNEFINPVTALIMNLVTEEFTNRLTVLIHNLVTVLIYESSNGKNLLIRVLFL